MEPIETVQDIECVGEDFGEDSLRRRGPTMAELLNEDPAKTLSLKRSGQQACSRCRRQKLRCDEYRPCILCVRSGFECREPYERQKKTKTTNQSVQLELLPRPSSNIPEPSLPEAVGVHSQVTGSIHSPTNPRNAFTAVNSQPVAETSPTFHERTSTVDLMDQMFQKHNASPSQKRVVDALPGSRLDDTNPDSSRGNQVSVQELIGMSLPPRSVTDLLLTSYLENYHWHLLLFHFPTLFNQIQPIRERGIVSKDRLSLVMLLLIILTIGARYVTTDTAHGTYSNKEIQQLGTDMKGKIEENFMRILDDTSIESITFTLLFASYSMYNRKPKRAYKLIQMAIRDAQAIGLNRESTWGQLDTTAREVRRRLWWSLYGCDGFNALMFGQPGIIRVSDYELEMQTDIDDTQFTCPGLGSIESRENGRTEPVTILSYHRYKVTLYEIAEPITRSVYSHKDAGIKNAVKHVHDIHKKLVRWYKRLPPELKLDSLAGTSTTPDKALSLDIFKRQALALQMSYDNMQIVLHRSLIAHEDSLGHARSLATRQGEQNDGNTTMLRNADAAAIKTSRNQCWESAIRTSQLVDHPTELQLIRSTPVAAYLAMHALTAGVILGIFALSDPSSDRAQQAKQGIARLIQMPAMVSFQDDAWQQCVGNLKTMLRLILSEELKVLMSGRPGMSGIATSLKSVPQASQTNEHHQDMSISNAGSLLTRSDGTQNRSVTQLSGGSGIQDAIDLTAGGNSPPVNADGGQQYALEMPSSSVPSVFSPMSNFSNAISSLQTIFRNNGSSDSASAGQQRGDVLGGNQPLSGLEPTASGSDQMNPGLEFVDNSFDSFGDVDQLWLWNDDFSFGQT
ncbi:hypothetical protein LTS03_002954 [Exophiala xenobiotica]|nr:hypothetical protein LTS06_004860 [Exophiala xenobiotica]KAK5351364.1 hypothetical protein LTR61_004713 [Exophiala xenobiotica]KAK5383704.1 hypothetical protein LTR11_002714 [Exophiala xenobiotica]KAK5384989.1 hypothetical protein LTS03_002954 [Exophiala xenobiotica]KAK5416878.1 hypothetical protein LTR06_002864 [Exophiala xenobiotica]